jgi:hypothetical protein
MAKRDYDFGKRIQRSNAKADADRQQVVEAISRYHGLWMCERCSTEQEHSEHCHVCGEAR